MRLLTSEDFLDATAFERSILGTVYPLVRSGSARTTADLRTNITTIGLGVILSGSSRRDDLIRDLRPLLFGAAWKVLDLLVEHGLRDQRSRGSHWPIEDKRRSALNADIPPLSTDLPIWTRMASLYNATVEARHCLVHRQFVLTPDGDVSGVVNKMGQAVPDVLATEQIAFCRAVQRCAVALQLTRFDARDRLDLVASLDELTRHHGHARLGGGTPSRVPELIRVNATPVGGAWTVDVASALERARTVFPGGVYYDVEINFPDSGLSPMVGRLEDAPPDHALAIDPAHPPPWVDP